MSNVFFISDLHFGHKKIIEFGNRNGEKWRSGDDYLENMHNIIQNWNAVITKRDVVWVLGDVAFTDEGFNALFELNGRKRLVMGNHDPAKFPWHKVFERVQGLTTYKGFWVSHCPIHPQEMRNRKGNIHGHLHMNEVLKGTGEVDKRYYNVCCEHTSETPLPFETILERYQYQLDDS